MKFSDVENECNVFSALLSSTTDREIVDVVSVQRPTPPENELHFNRIIFWAYVFFVEVAASPIKHIQSILRGSEPITQKTVSDTIRLVEGLRTYFGHQLSEHNQRDLKTKLFVTQWLEINAGEAAWERRCEVLCADIVRSVGFLALKWQQLTADQAEATDAVSKLIMAMDRQWPAHRFDRMVEDAAAELGITGIDSKTYRQIRLESWQKLVGCFDDTLSAEIAMRQAVHADLWQTFCAGQPVP